MTVKLAGADIDKIMAAGLLADRVMVGTGSAAVEVWAAIQSFFDDFNRADQYLTAAGDYEYFSSSPSYVNLSARIVGNRIEAADPGTTEGATVLGRTAPKYVISSLNRAIEADFLGPNNTQAQAGLSVRATSDFTKGIQFNVVAASHGGISTTADGASTNRTAYDQAQLLVGDRIGFEAYNDVYVAYCKRGGIRRNLTSYTDTGGAIVPLTARRYGLYINAARLSGVTQKGSPLDNFAAFGLPDRVAGQFIETGLRRPASSLAWTGGAAGTWADITGMVSDSACPGSVASGAGVVVRGSKLGANLVASIPFSGSLGTRQHLLRFVRANGTVVGSASASVTASTGIAVIATTGDVTDGEVIRLQMSSNGTSSGSIPANTLGYFQIT